MRFGQGLNQGCLDEKPIPQPLSQREFSPAQLLAIVFKSGNSHAYRSGLQ